MCRVYHQTLKAGVFYLSKTRTRLCASAVNVSDVSDALLVVIKKILFKAPLTQLYRVSFAEIWSILRTDGLYTDLSIQIFR